MTIFPSLEPIDRSYSLGAHPVAAVEVQNGDEIRFLYSTNSTGVPLALEFRGLSLEDVQQLRFHWVDQLGTTRAFAIPAHLWRTHASQYDVVPSTALWRYASQPVERRAKGGLFDVSISLISVI